MSEKEVIFFEVVIIGKLLSMRDLYLEYRP